MRMQPTKGFNWLIFIINKSYLIATVGHLLPKISEFIQNDANIVKNFSRFMIGYLKSL